MDIIIYRLKNELRQFLQKVTQFFQSFQISELSKTNFTNNHENVRLLIVKNWISKIFFFDFIAEKSESVINLEKYVFYRDVYTFVDRFRNVNFVREKNKFRSIISQCLRKTALTWHFIEWFHLTDLKADKQVIIIESLYNIAPWVLDNSIT